MSYDRKPLLKIKKEDEILKISINVVQFWWCTGVGNGGGKASSRMVFKGELDKYWFQVRG